MSTHTPGARGGFRGVVAPGQHRSADEQLAATRREVMA
jgi:hypothetical protein